MYSTNEIRYTCIWGIDILSKKLFKKIIENTLDYITYSWHT